MKPGEVALLKATEEQVFILDIRKGTDFQHFPQLSGQVAVVRRARLSKDGVLHSQETFTIEELESVDERQKRQAADLAELRAQYDNLNPTPDTATAARSN